MRSVDVLAQEVDSLRESMAIVRNDIEAVEQVHFVTFFLGGGGADVPAITY